MHVFGIIFLFLAAILPLDNVAGVAIRRPKHACDVDGLAGADLLACLDATLGLAIVGVAGFLLWTAAMIVDHVSVHRSFITSVVLIVIGVASQIVGHRVFERRQPALVDNPSHLLMGPMFVMAKLFIALGYSETIWPPIIDPATLREPSGASSSPGARQVEHPPAHDAHACHGRLAASSGSTGVGACRPGPASARS